MPGRRRRQVEISFFQVMTTPTLGGQSVLGIYARWQPWSAVVAGVVRACWPVKGVAGCY